MTRCRSICRHALVALALLVGASGVRAQELDASLNETVVTVPKKGVFSIDIETTLYKPDGAGPFPLVVINHGKAFGEPRFQQRYRPAQAARWFLQRGYAVAVPMRQGFAKSGGIYVGGGCNVESNGRAQAEDVKAALDYLATQSFVDMGRVLILGQSHGGWTTLAYGTQPAPGVKGLINFAGGLRQDNCAGWENTLARSAGAYGKETPLPSLWFYGDNDSYFSPSTWKPMAEQYNAAGGKARVVAFGVFGSDAHALFGARNGLNIWQPEVTAFLKEIGMPAEPLAEHARYGRAATTPVPSKTDFAALDDAARVPFVNDAARAGYQAFLGKTLPRAFAIAPNGAWGWAEGGDDPLKRALDNCGSRGKGACKLYAVDADVVWKSE